MSMSARRTVRRFGLVVFAGVAIVEIVNSVVIVVLGVTENWPVAVIRMISAASLEAACFGWAALRTEARGSASHICAVPAGDTGATTENARIDRVAPGDRPFTRGRTDDCPRRLWVAGLAGLAGFVD
jgi:hypothetical protein